MATLEQFSDLVGDVYDAALDPTLWDQTLKRVFSVAGGNNAALVVYDREKRRRPHIVAANFDTVQKRKYDEYFNQLDPLASILERTTVGVIVTARAVTTESQRRGEFYADWAHPNETGDTVFVNVLDSNRGVCTFMMGRPWCSEPFATPEVLRFVNLLSTHLRRAMQAQLGFGPLNLVRDGALDLVDQWRHGCVLVSVTGGVLYANPAANEIAASWDGLSLGTRGLRAARVPDDAALQRLIHQACTGNRQGPRCGGRLRDIARLRPQALYDPGPAASIKPCLFQQRSGGRTHFDRRPWARGPSAAGRPSRPLQSDAGGSGGRSPGASRPWLTIGGRRIARQPLDGAHTPATRFRKDGDSPASRTGPAAHRT